MEEDLTWPYIGSLGRLIEVPFTAAESISRENRYVTETTVEGRRRVQVRPVSPRSWAAEMPLALPGENNVVEAFISGAWGNGPWHWVPVQAQQGNLLTPREAQLLDRAGVSGSLVQDAGPVRAADGSWVPRSVTVSASSGWVALARDVPVLPGSPFTFSCDVQGGATPGALWVVFRDAAGGSVMTGAESAPNAGMHRVSYTATVPVGAVSAEVGVRASTLRAARPQVTWTDGPVPWSAGHGCRAAILEGLSSDLVVIDDDGPVSKVGFTVLEVS